MANPYAYNVLTFAGAALIAQATAANPIVIVGAVSRATAASSDEDLAAKDASWYTGKTGMIEAVSASANVAKIVARFDPEGARQDAKSVAVTARLASQTDADAIVLTAKSDPDATSILPGSGATLSHVRFPFNIYIQTSGSVQVTPGASASIADLERFVSLHKAGDPTQGEAQTILGEKTFAATMHAADISASGDVGCANITASSDITTAQSFVCSGQGRLRARGTLDCMATVTGDTEATLRLDASTPNEPEFFVDLWNVGRDRMARLCLTKDCELYLESDLTVTRIGRASAPIDYIIANNLFSKDVVSVTSQNTNNTTSASINLLSDATDDPVMEVVLENSSGDTVAFVSIYADASEKCYLTMRSDLYETSIGKPQRKIDHIYANALHGVIPYSSSESSDPPVGSITMLRVLDTGSLANINVGDQIQGGGTRQVAYAVWAATDGEWQARGHISNTPVFRAISGGSPVYSSTPNTYYNYVLAIRVE